MPQRDVSAYLADIQAAIAAIEASVAGVQFETYCSVRQIRSSVEREFMIIGEAVRQMLDVDPALENRVTSARPIVAFRNHLVHGYFLISDATVWDIIQGHLPKLRQEIAQLASKR